MEVDGGHGLRGMVASASVDGTAKLWDLGKRADVQTFKGHAVRRRRQTSNKQGGGGRALRANQCYEMCWPHRMPPG